MEGSSLACGATLDGLSLDDGRSPGGPASLADASEAGVCSGLDSSCSLDERSTCDDESSAEDDSALDASGSLDIGSRLDGGSTLMGDSALDAGSRLDEGNSLAGGCSLGPLLAPSVTATANSTVCGA